MKPKDKKHAEFVERKGQWLYLLLGGLVVGAFLFFISGLSELKQQSVTEIYFSSNSIFPLFLWLNAGIALSIVQWWTDKKVYLKRKARQTPNEETGLYH